jgi:hypothetical protein
MQVLLYRNLRNSNYKIADFLSYYPPDTFLQLFRAELELVLQLFFLSVSIENLEEDYFILNFIDCSNFKIILPDFLFLSQSNHWIHLTALLEIELFLHFRHCLFKTDFAFSLLNYYIFRFYYLDADHQKVRRSSCGF